MLSSEINISGRKTGSQSDLRMGVGSRLMKIQVNFEELGPRAFEARGGVKNERRIEVEHPPPTKRGKKWPMSNP